MKGFITSKNKAEKNKPILKVALGTWKMPKLEQASTVNRYKASLIFFSVSCIIYKIDTFCLVPIFSVIDHKTYVKSVTPAAFLICDFFSVHQYHILTSSVIYY